SAINNLRDGGSMAETEKLIKEGEVSLTKAHKSQTELLAKEAGGDDIQLGFIFVHGQDHLMTTVLLKDILQHLLNIYRNEESKWTQLFNHLKQCNLFLKKYLEINISAQ